MTKKTRFVNVWFACAADDCTATSEWMVPMKPAHGQIGASFALSAYEIPDGWAADNSNHDPWCPTHAPERNQIVEARRQELWRQQQELQAESLQFGAHVGGDNCPCQACGIAAAFATYAADPYP